MSQQLGRETQSENLTSASSFKDAEWLVVEGDDKVVRWSIRYRVSDRAALETYFNKYAPDLRAEGQKLFGDRFTASRRILSPH